MIKSIKIIADDKIPYLKGALEPFAIVQYVPGNEINHTILKDADTLITRTRTICNKDLLEGTKVKLIASATIGYDHIDTEYCNSEGISWTNAPGCNSGSVAQYIASALVRLSIKYNFDFSDKTIGIIGHGNVGSKVAHIAKILGMRVLVNDPPLKRNDKLPDSVSINEIYKQSDILTFHVPLNKDGMDKTLKMLDEEVLDSIKPGSMIINSSRGEIFDNEALKKALKNKKIKGAVLDVWENEPNIDTELLNLLDFATPHIAGYSVDGKANGTAMSVQAISKYYQFGLDNWLPSNLPKPENAEIKIDCKGKTRQAIFAEAILATYDIALDDRLLRNSVNTFEEQRGNYPFRREFQIYTLSLTSDESHFANVLSEIGFKI
jgi:erythronate-4-phosphate dehydrogenase